MHTMGLCTSRHYTVTCCDWATPLPRPSLAAAAALLDNPAVLSVHYCATQCTVVLDANCGAQDNCGADCGASCDAAWVAGELTTLLRVPVVSYDLHVRSRDAVRDALHARAQERWAATLAQLASAHCAPSLHSTSASQQLAALAAAGIFLEDVPYWERWGVTMTRSEGAPVSVTYLPITAATDPAVLVGD